MNQSNRKKMETLLVQIKNAMHDTGVWHDEQNHCDIHTGEGRLGTRVTFQAERRVVGDTIQSVTVALNTDKRPLGQISTQNGFVSQATKFYQGKWWTLPEGVDEMTAITVVAPTWVAGQGQVTKTNETGRSVASAKKELTVCHGTEQTADQVIGDIYYTVAESQKEAAYQAKLTKLKMNQPQTKAPDRAL